MTVTRKIYTPTAHTGGLTGCLDAIAVATISNDDLAFLAAADGSGFYVYKFNSISTVAESFPDFIRPDDFTTAGVWENQTSPFGSNVHVGSLVILPYSTVPSDLFECNGAAISRTTYSALFATIGVTYGAGDGVTTFNIPDYRGVFLRGWANGEETDPDRAARTDRGDGTPGDNVGTWQDDQVGPHTHPVIFKAGTAGGNYIGGTSTASADYTGATSANTGNQTNPINVYVMICIKY